MQISFVMPIFLLFLDQISGGGKSLRGENCLRGAPPALCGRKPELTLFRLGEGHIVPPTGFFLAVLKRFAVG